VKLKRRGLEKGRSSNVDPEQEISDSPSMRGARKKRVPRQVWTNNTTTSGVISNESQDQGTGKERTPSETRWGITQPRGKVKVAGASRAQNSKKKNREKSTLVRGGVAHRGKQHQPRENKTKHSQAKRLGPQKSAITTPAKKNKKKPVVSSTGERARSNKAAAGIGSRLSLDRTSYNKWPGKGPRAPRRELAQA